VRATPAARRAARERGVDIEAVAKAFPGKVLSEDDVKNFES
jgi:pyruvate/2-oxoglutarate dehydrogenase complex dihydrolipoamide acyltransferase (E2) component